MSRSNRRFLDNADIAQLVERVLGKDEVSSSNLDISSIRMPTQSGGHFSVLKADLCGRGIGKSCREIE